MWVFSVWLANLFLTEFIQRGYYQLDKGVTASQNSIYYFQGQLAQASARSALKGPVTGKEYTYRDAFGIASVNYSASNVYPVIDLSLTTNCRPLRWY
jgi:hypothetical protein